MEKIIVIGSPGAGKSSFSKKLKNIMNFEKSFISCIQLIQCKISDRRIFNKNRLTTAT